MAPRDWHDVPLIPDSELRAMAEEATRTTTAQDAATGPADYDPRAHILAHLANPDLEPERRAKLQKHIDLMAMTVEERRVHDLAEEHYARAKARRIAEERLRAEHEPDVAWSFEAASAVWSSDPDEAAIVASVLPSGGSTLVTAPFKAGKTTLVLNLLQSLTSGEPFLGSLAVDEPRRVAYLNYELTRGEFTAYSRALLTHPDDVLVASLAGRANPLATPRGRAALAAAVRAHGASVVVVDPFSSAAGYMGFSNGDNETGRAWLDELHRWAIEDCGAAGLVLVSHAGRTGEHSRGFSAIEDWAHQIVRLTLSAPDAYGGARFVSGFGRLGLLAEDRLEHDAATGRIALTGAGSRTVAATGDRATTLVPALRELFESYDVRMNTTELKAAAGVGASADDHRAVRVALDSLTGGPEPYLRVERGPKNAKVYSRINHDAEIFASIEEDGERA
jgi:hypothetical protein